MIGFDYLGKMGQLGNQMFQYASLKGIANNNGHEYCVPNHNELIVDVLGNRLRIELFEPFTMNGCNNNSVIGNNCIIHSGTVIGSDGFGFVPDEKGEFNKVPQTGNVVIEDNVDIGSGSTIDRATLGSTIIRRGVKLDNQIQVAHNVEIGKNTVIAAQTGIAGSTKVGENCMIGGQVGISGHLKIGNNVKILALSLIHI